MIYSLNEIDAHCKKAARGAGFEWGYAEDIGKAARWLASYDLPGVELLAVYLNRFYQHPEQFCQPDFNTETSIKASGNGPVCPVLTGAYLCDSAAINKTQILEIENLYFPLLLLPYLSQVANTIGQTLAFEYQSIQFQFENGKLHHSGDESIRCEIASHAKITISTNTIEGKCPAVVGQDINQPDWDSLNRFAAKTYVPATEASRQGAGPAE